MKREIDISNFSKITTVDKRRLASFVRRLDKELSAQFKAREGDLSVAIFDDKQIAKIHADFMHKPDPTDVITFEGEDEMLGEVCASAERALDWCKKFGTTPSEELSLYVAHGYLHLAGIDDIAEEDALIMRAGEREALAILRKHYKKPIFKYNV